jgi:quercetin dioxygenase-like cupin family protein
MTMSKKTLKLMAVGAFVAGAFGVIALRAAWATPPKGLTQALLAGPVLLDDIHVVSQSRKYGVMIKTRGLSDAYVVRNSIAPGGNTGWHSHPGPVFVLVTAGTATNYDADDPTLTPTVYRAGTGFVDAGGGHVHIVRNEGDTDLELVVFFLVPRGAPRRIDEPAPLGAPF